MISGCWIKSRGMATARVMLDLAHGNHGATSSGTWAHPRVTSTERVTRAATHLHVDGSDQPGQGRRAFFVGGPSGLPGQLHPDALAMLEARPHSCPFSCCDPHSHALLSSLRFCVWRSLSALSLISPLSLCTDLSSFLSALYPWPQFSLFSHAHSPHRSHLLSSRCSLFGLSPNPSKLPAPDFSRVVLSVLSVWTITGLELSCAEPLMCCHLDALCLDSHRRPMCSHLSLIRTPIHLSLIRYTL